MPKRYRAPIAIVPDDPNQIGRAEMCQRAGLLPNSLRLYIVGDYDPQLTLLSNEPPGNWIADRATFFRWLEDKQRWVGIARRGWIRGRARKGEPSGAE